MGARNGKTVYDIITSGYRREVTSIGSNGTLGVSIPANFVDEHEIQRGDDVAIREKDGKAVLEIHFE